MKKLKLIIPKGKIFDNTIDLLKQSGIYIDFNSRHYIPHVNIPEIEAKIMKPQNIAQIIEIGSHDIGFTGYDWIAESGAEVEQILDLNLDPVKIVSAVPEGFKDPTKKKREIIVASEYRNLSTQYLRSKKYDFLLIQTSGATEAFPPQDADMIIDNISTGRTLKEHGLIIKDEIMVSSTRFIANKKALQNKWKREKIEELTMLFTAVLNAKERVMLEMNVPPEKLESLVKIIPCMRAPTVSSLYAGQGYAVKVAVKKGETLNLIPLLKKMGATDILEYELKKVIT
ncbi:MAG: ATP phosphoribosyltransferase [Candidatus Aminicenantes bacterium]|nr:ATP phosphoribosyltransferase [Candidatus Aminicenantes bacterium]